MLKQWMLIKKSKHLKDFSRSDVCFVAIVAKICVKKIK